jgi:hypothetical protein
MANRQYHKVEAFHRLASIHSILILKPPLRLLRLPARLYGLVVEPNLIVDLIFGRDALPVGEDLGALSIFLAPLGVWSETGLVDIRRDIAAYTRVSVLEPRTTLGCVRQIHRKDHKLLAMLETMRRCL